MQVTKDVMNMIEQRYLYRNLPVAASGSPSEKRSLHVFMVFSLDLSLRTTGIVWIGKLILAKEVKAAQNFIQFLSLHVHSGWKVI